MSSKAKDRSLSEWFNELNKGAIKLPRFQRHEAWDHSRISSLLKTIIHDLPLGITLVLEVDTEKFISRYMETATPDDTSARVTEHLLDGQQRLTALWRTLHNNYPETSYFVYVPELDSYDEKPWSPEWDIFVKGRYLKNDQLYPLWVDKPSECLQRGLIPTNLLKPIDMSSEIDEWIEQATRALQGDEPEQLKNYYKTQEKIKKIISEIRENIKHYNLPYLALPSDTHQDTALQVFINMNTNSKPLSRYDIIVAEIEAVKGVSLHDLQAKLDNDVPNVKSYEYLSKLILNVSALLQNKLPNERGAIEMDKALMVDNWSLLEKGLKNMVTFLESQGIIDSQRLPTNAVLSVIAALYSSIPDKGDLKGGADILLRRYLWSSFFTDRYENSTATHAYSDYLALFNALNDLESSKQYDISSIPVLDRELYPLADVDELNKTKWPKKANIRARAILAVSTYLGAQDFADGKTLSRSTIHERDYHHIYPDSLLKESGVESYLALNCALITDITNRHLIRRKDPLVYVNERKEWIDEETLQYRLQTHIIPIKELETQSYDIKDEEVRSESIKNDFEKFIAKRGELIYAASELLTEGQQIDFGKVEAKRLELFDTAQMDYSS